MAVKNRVKANTCLIKMQMLQNNIFYGNVLVQCFLHFKALVTTYVCKKKNIDKKPKFNIN